MHVEGEKVSMKYYETEEEFRKQFEKVVNDLGFNKFSSCRMENIIDEINSLTSKLKSSPRILKVKQLT